MGKLKDLSGQKFGRLTVLEQSENKRGKVCWKCQCECGNIKNVVAGSLLNGKTKSCGCLQREASKNKYKDISGQRFGKFIAVRRLGIKRYSEKSSQSLWECKCDCGNIFATSYSSISSGKTLSCGCYQKELIRQRLTKDIKGMAFGRLTAIEIIEYKRSDIGASSAIWKCKCSCGNETTASANSLLSGHIKSCGCFQKERITEVSLKDITGQRFGRLVALKRNGSNSNNEAMWNCICDCGNTCNVSGRNLRSGRTVSCGCQISKGELKIHNYLLQNNILHNEQYSFNDLKSSFGAPLRFDFYLPLYNLCIEYDGEGHYSPINWNGCSDDKALISFDTIKRNDELKNKYCKDNNVNLLRISYPDYDNIEKILDDYLSNIPCCQEQGATEDVVT